MSLTLMSKIEEALKKIDSISENERSVQLNGQEIILGIVSGAEEEIIQAYVAERGEKLGKSGILRDIKVETIAYAIKAINGERIDKIDFFNVTDPETNISTKIERHIFLRDKLKGWAPFILNYLFTQYAALIDESSKTFNPKFEIAGLEPLQDEIAEQEKVLKYAEELSEKEKSETTFREIPNPEDGGVMDQAGR